MSSTDSSIDSDVEVQVSDESEEHEETSGPSTPPSVDETHAVPRSARLRNRLEAIRNFRARVRDHVPIVPYNHAYSSNDSRPISTESNPSTASDSISPSSTSSSSDEINFIGEVERVPQLPQADVQEEAEPPALVSPSKNEVLVKKEEETISKSVDASEEEIGTCSICYEPFNSSSEHRIVCLKCGHLYGNSCIKQWLATNGTKTRCPECNMPVKKNDIRVIYARSVKVLDTSERDEALQQLAKVKEQNVQLQEQTDDLKMVIGLRDSEIYKLKRELVEKDFMIEGMKGNRIANHLLNAKNKTLERRREPFRFMEKLHINTGACRHLAVSELLGFIFVSHENNSPLYRGFGLRKYMLSNLKRYDFIFLHEKMIKDVAMHPSDALILTSSIDRTVKVTNLINSSVVCTIRVPNDPWSLCWDGKKADRFYTGLNNGKVISCCTSTGTTLQEFNTTLHAPIVALNFIPTWQDNKAGLLITSLNKAIYGQIEVDSNCISEEPRHRMLVNSLNIEDRFVSSHVLENRSNGTMLLSCRPNQQNPHVHHYVIDYNLEETEGPMMIRTDLQKNLCGGTTSSMLTKSKIYTHPDNVNSALICTSDEDEKGLLIWEKEMDDPMQRIKCNSIVMDVSIMKICNPSGTLLSILTETDLFLYTWNL